MPYRICRAYGDVVNTVNCEGIMTQLIEIEITESDKAEDKSYQVGLRLGRTMHRLTKRRTKMKFEEFDKIWKDTIDKIDVHLEEYPALAKRRRYDLDMNRKNFEHYIVVKGAEHWNCVKCGMLCYKGMYVKPVDDKLYSEKLCHSCDTWNQRAVNHATNPFIVIGGLLYRDNGCVDRPSESKRHTLGHGGRLFHIRMMDGKIIITNNLWFCGEVPKSYIECFKNNAEFL